MIGMKISGKPIPEIDARPGKIPVICVWRHAQQVDHGVTGDRGTDGDQISRLHETKAADDHHHDHGHRAARRDRKAGQRRGVAEFFLQQLRQHLAWSRSTARRFTSMMTKQVPNWRPVSILMSISGCGRLSSQGMNRQQRGRRNRRERHDEARAEPVVDLAAVQHDFEAPRKVAISRKPTRSKFTPLAQSLSRSLFFSGELGMMK